MAGRPAAPSRRARSRHAPELVNPDELLELTAEMVVRFRAIHQVVRQIPRGRVVTYGQLAELAGFPGASRMAGAAMKKSDGLPWQRVVGKAGPRRGRIAIHDPVGAAVQRHKLAEEGVPVSEAGLIDLSEYGWLDAEPLRRVAKRASTTRAAAVGKKQRRP